jgi:hypothetical protein
VNVRIRVKLTRTHLFFLEQFAFEQNVKDACGLHAKALAHHALGVTQPSVVQDADNVCVRVCE